MAEGLKEFDKKAFYKTVFTLGTPVILQTLLTNVLNMVDTVMVGRLGELDVAAVAVANRLVNIFLLALFGLCSGLTIFVAQYYGARDNKNICRLCGFTLCSASVIALVFAALYFAFAPSLISFFVNDSPQTVAEVVQKGSSYLRIITASMLFNALSYALASILRGIRLPKYPLYASAVSLCINTALNYILIFGKLGFRPMGVEGAAIATLIARVCEAAVIISVVFVFKKDSPLYTERSIMFKWEKRFVKKLIKTGVPVLVNETMWSAAQTYYVAIVGFLGASSVAVIQISSTITTMIWSLFMGVSTSCAVMVGNAIGAADIKKARAYSVRFVFLAVVLAFVCASLIILFKEPLMSLFTLEAETVVMLRKTITVTALTMGFGMVNNIFIVGIFRSGGDTRFCMLLEMVTMWLIGIPAVYVGVHMFRVPVYIAAVLLQTDNFVKLFISIWRYRSMKWINRVI